MPDDDAGNGGQQQQTGSQAGSAGEAQQAGSTGDNQQGQQTQSGQQGGQPSQQTGQQQGQQGSQGNGSGGHDGNTGRPPGGEQTFTQADLDRIVGERLARERGKFTDYDDLKAKAGELDELKRSQMSDQEKAVDVARAEAKAEAAKEYGASLVDAEIRVATTGRMSDEQRAALLDGLDRSRFLTKDHKVDGEKVRTFIGAVAPAPPPATPPPPVTGGTRMGQGRHPANSEATLLTGRERYEQKHKRKTT